MPTSHLLSAATAREITAGLTSEELLIAVSREIGAAARAGQSRVYINETIVRGIADWSGASDTSVIGMLATSCRAEGYTIKKTMVNDKPHLVIEWKEVVKPQVDLGLPEGFLAGRHNS